MGPRIREDNGWGRGMEDGGRVALRLGDGDGLLHPREKRMGEREEGRWAGGVAAGGRGGFPHTRGHGWGRGRKDGGRVALREGRLLNTMALNIPKFRSFEVIRRWLL